jgi:hypothetical protein
MREIHSFEDFSISEFNGEYFKETDDGNSELILSPNGSAEHKAIAAWIENVNRKSTDF